MPEDIRLRCIKCSAQDAVHFKSSYSDLTILACNNCIREFTVNSQVYAKYQQVRVLKNNAATLELESNRLRWEARELETDIFNQFFTLGKYDTLQKPRGEI